MSTFSDEQIRWFDDKFQREHLIRIKLRRLNQHGNAY